MKRIAVSIALLALAALPTHGAEMNHSHDMKNMPNVKTAASTNAQPQVHKSQGTVNRIDEKTGKVNMAHQAIPSLNWPAMTMDFQVKDKALLKGLTPGQTVEFDIAQQGGGFVITRLAAVSGQPVQSAPEHSGAHKGH